MDYFLGIGFAVLVTVVVGTAMYFIMTYGTKEKTYDEAILEQRQRSEDALLFGRSTKEKQKEKKEKKKAAGKKVKEKSHKSASTKEASSDSMSSEETDHGNQHISKNQHVAFVQPEAAVIEEPAAAEESKKKKKKEVKAKPILVNKDDAQIPQEIIPPIDANHFHKIHPKDDLELRRQSKDESSERPSKKSTQKQSEAEKLAPVGKKEKEGVGKVEKAQQPKNEKSEKQAPIKQEKQTGSKNEKPLLSAPPKEQSGKEGVKPEKAEKLEKPVKSEKQDKPIPPKLEKQLVEEATTVAVSTIPVQASVSKSNKSKRKNEITLEQMSLGRDAITCSVIEPLLLNSELSRSEIQNLIDLLLNKQQGSEAEHAEWIEGRQDPMMKLKKAYAEKEKALQEEQEATQAVQNKLREVRAEANSERSRLSQTVRQLEEKLAARTAEVAASAAKMQHEKQVLTQQIQQLKHQMEQEHMVLRKMQEEQAQAQSAVQARQQLELHVGALSAQHQEQMQQMAEQCEMLSAQVAQLQEQHKNAQNASQGEVHSLHKQFSEMKAAKEDADRQLSAALQREGLLNNELTKLKELVAQRQVDIEKVVAEAAHLKDENERLSSQVPIVGQLQSENRQLREEIESLAAQVTAVTERPAAEGRENGDVAEEKHVDTDAKLMSAQLIHEEALREKDVQVEKLVEQVKQAENQASTTIESLKSEISSHKKQILLLTEELDHQKRKNDELRNKNHMAMEGIAASEKLLQSKMQESEKLVHETQKLVLLQEEKKTRELMQRLFPSVSIDEKVHSEWVKKFSLAAGEFISELSSKQSVPEPVVSEDQSLISDLEKRNVQLSNMVTNYKKIIEDTEGMLNKLQLHVEAEETKWRQQLSAIQVDLEAVKRERDDLLNRPSAEPNSQLQGQLESIQGQLTLAEAEKSRLQAELATSIEALASIEQLKEERNRLATDLATEQSKASAQSDDISKLKELLEISQDSLLKEKSNSQLLKEEIGKLKENSLGSPAPSSQTLNGATNGPVSSEAAVSEKAASTKKKNLSGWLKKKVGGSKSPNLSARGDEFLASERMDSAS